MYYVGDVAVNSTVRIMWNSNAVAGESITRATNGSIRIYKNNSTTERTSALGITDSEDFDLLTGIHHVNIDLSDNTDAGFYAAGNDYFVVLQGATIDGKVINAVLAQFSIENRSALRPTTAGRTLDVSAGGEAGVDWANVGTPGSTVSLSATTIATVTTTTTATNLTNLPTIPANWLTAAGTASDFGTEIATAIWTDTTAGDFTVALSIGKSIMNGVALGTGLTINAYTGNTVQTGDSFSRIGVAGAGLTDLGGFSTTAKAQIQTEAEDAIVIHRLDELLNADSDIDGLAPPTVGSVFHELMSKTAGSFTFDQTTDSNEAIRDRGDAAWITATGFSTHTAADVWTSATRTLTAATNITSTGGTTVPQTGDSFARLGAPAGASIAADVATRATPAQVNTEVLDVLNVDTFAQPGQEAPAATTTLQKMLAYLYKAWRNKKTQTATTRSLFADDAVTVDQKATDSDDGVTFTKQELGSGP